MASASYQDEFTALRLEMVKNQIRKRGISDDRLLAAFEKVPRHLFVPSRYISAAYKDTPLPIPMKQTISQPYIVACMIHFLGLKGDEKVLEIGTGSGYQTAILAELAGAVFTIEILPQLAKTAQRILSHLQYRNIHYLIGDGHAGWPENAPFDAIIVSAAPKSVPENLLDQLAPGGKMIIPVGDKNQVLRTFRKSEDGIKAEGKMPVRFVPMTGRAGILK